MTPSESEYYPLDADPFSDYIGRPPSPPLSAPAMSSCDTLVGSMRSSHKPNLLRKAHRPPPVEVPVTAYEDKEFFPDAESPCTDSDVPPGFVRVPIAPLPLWAQQLWDRNESAAKVKRASPILNEEKKCHPSGGREPVYFVMDPEWDPNDEESICFKFVDPPSPGFHRRHIRGGSEGRNMYGTHPRLPQRARAMTHLGFVEPSVRMLRRISEQMDEDLISQRQS